MMAWPASFQVRLVGMLVGLCCSLIMAAPAWSASDADHEYLATQHALLNVWFALQETGPVHAPYAYIRHHNTRAMVTARKQQLVEELDHLIWHLNAVGNQRVVAGLNEWRTHIQQADHYRAPGQWGPAWLLAGARNGVPVSAVAAVGACAVPGWVEIWSADGVKRIDWQPSMRLSTLVFDNGALHDAHAQRVALVTPYGRVVERGIAPWNFNDMPISPGMRIVVPLPLDGRVVDWMQQHLSKFLAHLTPGNTCRQIVLKHGSANESD